MTQVANLVIIGYVNNEQYTLTTEIDMTQEIINSVIILLQLTGAIIVVLLAWTFLSGLVERRSFKRALESVKEMMKEIPYILIGLAIFFCVLCFIGMFLG